MIDAGFDFDFEMALTALNRTLGGILTDLLIGGVTRFTQPLGIIPLGPLGQINFGVLDLELTGATVQQVRAAGTTHHGVDVDFDVVVRMGLSQVTFVGTQIPAISGDLVFPFTNLGLDLLTTAHGAPIGLAIQLKGGQLGPVQLTPPSAAAIAQQLQPPGPIVAAIVNLLLGIINVGLQAGFAIAAALVGSIPLIIKQIIDAFSVYGLRFFTTGVPAQDSPFVTAIPVDNLLLAADFQRLTPPPSGNPNLLGDILPAGDNVAVVLGQGGINQAIDTLLGKGVIPSVFRGGGFTFYLNQHDLLLLGPNSATDPNDPSRGAIELDFVLKGKRGSCWCQVKVTVYVKLRIWPKVVPGTIPAPVAGLQARQQGTTIQFDFDDKNRVKVSGFLVTLTEIILGPLLVLYLFLLSQIANLVLAKLLPYTYNTNIAGNQISLTVSSAQVAAFLTLSFDFAASIAASGSGTMDISQYTGVMLVDPQTFGGLSVDQKNSVDLKIDYNADSITIEDGEIRLAANLIR